MLSGMPESWLSAPAMALDESRRLDGGGVRREIDSRDEGGLETCGMGAGAATGTEPVVPGIRRRASKSCDELAAQVAAVCGDSACSGSGVLDMAAIGGGVEASKRRRSSAAEIEGEGSGGRFGLAMRADSLPPPAESRVHPSTSCGIFQRISAFQARG